MIKFLAGIITVMFSVILFIYITQTHTFAHSDQILFINEVMASNKSVLRDGDSEDLIYGNAGGAHSDWVEIHNSSSNTVNLKDYSLSDDSSTWNFPSVDIPPQGYLIVWASDKNKVGKDGQLHANFKISSSGETITLRNTDGNLVDSIEILSLEDNQSYGRTTDGGSEFKTFFSSTPGGSNKKPLLEDPYFSHKGGFYEEAFNLELSSKEQNSQIYYTVDGSDPVPGKSGTLLYSKSITIRSRAGEPNKLSLIPTSLSHLFPIRVPHDEVFKCSTIKALSMRSDGFKSSIVTHSYFVDSAMKERYDLPLISITTDYENFFDSSKGIYVNENYNETGDKWEKPIHIEFFEKDGNPLFSYYCGARIHGGLTRNSPQKSLRLYFDKSYDPSDKLDYPVFGELKDVKGNDITSFKRLILRNSGNDWISTMFRDPLMHSLVSDLNLDTQAYRPTIVFINGEYWGIHNVRERYDSAYFESHYNIDKNKVALLAFDPTFYPLSNKIDVNEGTQEDAIAYTNDIVNYIKIHSLSDKSTYDYLKTKIDIENFINYQIANIYFGNVDWPTNNVSTWKYKTEDGLYHPEAPYGQDGRWRWLIKDTDYGFGLLDGDVTYDTLAKVTTHAQPDTRGAQYSKMYLLNKFIENPDFRIQFINSFADHLNTTFNSKLVIDRIHEMSSQIQSSIPEHINRWGNITDWDENVTMLKTFGEKRPYHVRQHIVKKFSPNGVTGTASITLNTDMEKGYLRINSIDIKSTTKGVFTLGSWTGIYFIGVPVTIKALPQEGYVFDHWEGLDAGIYVSDTINITPDEIMNITAVFRPQESATPVPLHYGDLNRDSITDSTDYALLKRYILELIKDLPAPIKNADLNSDGRIDSCDLALMKRHLVLTIQ